MEADKRPVEREDEGAPRGPMARKGRAPSLWALWHATPAARFVRLGTFLVVVLGGGSWLMVQHSEAQLADDLLGAGNGLLQFTQADDEDGPRLIRINGEVVHLTSGTREDALDEVLDEFAEICLDHDAMFTEEVHRFGEEHPDAPRAEILPLFNPVYRTRHEESGVVACLDMGEGRRSAEDILDAYGRFRENGDLSEMGDIRYLYAQRVNDTHTHFVSLWTEGPFHPSHILPDNTDAPGEDLAGLPRPPRSRRVLSAWQEGRDDRFYRYEGSSMTEWELEGYYRDELTERGWTVLDEAGNEGRSSVGVLAMRDGRQLYVSLDTDRHGDGNATLILSE